MAFQHNDYQAFQQAQQAIARAEATSAMVLEIAEQSRIIAELVALVQYLQRG